MDDNTTVIYRIDAQDNIVFVNNIWEQFAISNDASECASENVLTQSLWDSVSDYASRQIYQEIIHKVRANKRVAFNFRCDSPEWRRFLEMDITAQKDEVQFEIRTLKTEQRPPQHILDKNALRSDDFIEICGWCKKVDVGQENWIEVEEAVRTLGIFEQERFPELSHGMCEKCYETMAD
jgi:hypothetical protein